MPDQNLIIQECRQLIEQLPQRSAIRNADIDLWIAGVLERDPERLLWHTKRLFGVGGSDVGALILCSRGEFAFTDASEIFNQLLLRGLPDGSSPDTERGTETETMILAKTHAKLGARRDEDAIGKMLATAQAPYPWMPRNINVDDILCLPDGRRLLTDAKHPRGTNAWEYADKGVPLEYAAQLNYYELAAAARGLSVDGLLLAPFSSDLWDVFPILVPSSDELKKTIIEVCDTFWAGVLAGELPAIFRKDRDLDAKALPPPPAIAQEMANRYAGLRALANATYKEAEDTRDELHKLLGRRYHGLPDGRTRVGVCSLKLETKTLYASEAMLEMARDLEISESEYSVLTPDDDKLFAVLEKRGCNVAGLRRVEQVPSLSTPRSNAKSSAGVYMRETIRPQAVEALSRYRDAIIPQIQQEFPPTEPRPAPVAASPAAPSVPAAGSAGPRTPPSAGAPGVARARPGASPSSPRRISMARKP